MKFETAIKIYTDLEEITTQKSREIRDMLYKSAVKYAHIRANWRFLEPDDRAESDKVRRISHNALIDACNILSRNIIKEGEGAAWRGLLGNDRKKIGDFACYLACIIGLESR